MTEYTDDKSRTEIKNEANELQRLGERLISLTSQQLSCIDIPEELKDAVLAAKTISSNKAKRRQHQFIGSLMRQIDPEPVVKAIQAIESGLGLKKNKSNTIEQLLDGLVSGDKTVAESILAKHPGADRQRLRQLIRNAQKKQIESKNKKATTALLNYLKEISVK